MQELPHHYKVSASGAREGKLALESEALQPIETASPREFGGPGNLWSPETMLAGAVAGCFILSFRAIARASSFPWLDLTCEAEGRLERADGTLQFTEFTLRPTLKIPTGGDRGRAIRLLEKAESGCLVANSLRSSRRLEPAVIEAPAETTGEAR
ncbi:MAG: OsmC family protein [Candidatus Binatus sp.]|uniref:OsmC family protein n=1 Tax=Candidatus Binatus sp. TaxID=2811406 RepID=UPI003C777D2D